MKCIAALCLAMALSSCGVDGAPVTPNGDETVASDAMPGVSDSS